MMSELVDFVKESLFQLDVRIIVDTNSLHEFYKSRYNGDYDDEIWHYLCDSFANSRLIGFSHEENPENKVDELINEFIEAYPELGSTVWFYFSD